MKTYKFEPIVPACFSQEMQKAYVEAQKFQFNQSLLTALQYKEITYKQYTELFVHYDNEN